MVAKKSKSKRVTLQQKYKIKKRTKEHHKRLKKGRLEGNFRKKKDDNFIPNAWPYKEELLKEIKTAQERMEAAKSKQKEKRLEEIVCLNIYLCNSNDFLDEIRPTLTKLGGKEFDTDTIFALDKWYDSLENRKPDVEYYFKQIIKISNSEYANNPQQKHKVENHINNLIKKVDEKQKEVVKFFQVLKQLLIGNSTKMKTI